MVSKEGKSYSKSALIGIQGAIQHHLTSGKTKRIINIVSGPQFKPANDVLIGKIKKMKRDGLDVSKSHPPISHYDKEKMYNSKTLTDENPTALQMKIFF